MYPKETRRRSTKIARRASTSHLHDVGRDLVREHDKLFPCDLEGGPIGYPESVATPLAHLERTDEDFVYLGKNDT